MNSIILKLIVISILTSYSFGSGFFSNLFKPDSLECNSPQVLALSDSIIKEKLISKLNDSSNKVVIDDILYNVIITTNMNENTGARVCKAKLDMLGYFKIKNKIEKDKIANFFNLLFGSDNAFKIGDNYYLIHSAPISYTVELTTDKKQLYVSLSFNGQKGEYLYSKSTPNLSNKEQFDLVYTFAKKGNYVAQNKIGLMYDAGIGVKQNVKEGFNWFKKSADQNFHWGLYNLGNLYFVNKDYNNAYTYLKKSAQIGNSTAQNKLGLMYEYAKGIEKNINEATKWYKKSAAQNDMWGLYNLGMLYYKNKDYKNAYTYLKRSANLDNYYSMNQLGIMYFNGIYVKKDQKKGLDYYTKSANGNYDTAINNLGYIYFNGVDVKKDYDKAAFYYKKLADKGDIQALINMGYIYYSKKYKEQDYKKAFEYFNAAAQKGDHNAQSMLGRMYILGLGTEKNKKEAKKWLQKSAIQGNPYAKKTLKILSQKSKEKIDSVKKESTVHKALSSKEIDTKTSILNALDNI